MKRIALVLLTAAALPPIGTATPARAQAAACAAYPPGSAAYVECWRRASESQTNSFWWQEMDRRARLEYRAGQ